MKKIIPEILHANATLLQVIVVLLVLQVTLVTLLKKVIIVIIVMNLKQYIVKG